MKNKILRNDKGFTLIEIIGVLAVIAILAAMLAPRVFETIADSKSNRMANEIKAMKAGVANWYRDIGTLQSLTAGGIPNNAERQFHRDLLADESAGAGTGLWSKWNGPYLDSSLDSVQDLSSLPIGGTLMTIQTQIGTVDFDLDGIAPDDTIGTQVVYLEIQNVDPSDFIRVDRILDAGMIAEGTNGVNGQQGKVEYDGSSVMHVYIAHN